MTARAQDAPAGEVARGVLIGQSIIHGGGDLWAGALADLDRVLAERNELLTALRVCVASLREVARDHPDEYLLGSEHDAACAALAHAEGRTP